MHTNGTSSSENDAHENYDAMEEDVPDGVIATCIHEDHARGLPPCLRRQKSALTESEHLLANVPKR